MSVKKIKQNATAVVAKYTVASYEVARAPRPARMNTIGSLRERKIETKERKKSINQVRRKPFFLVCCTDMSVSCL